MIDLDDVRKSYGSVTALRGVSLRVRKGEIFGLLGPNGAGKTTLIKTLVGSVRADSGSVRVMGLDPFRDVAEIRRQVGYMPQAPVLYEDLSARDNVRFFAQAHELSDLEQRVDAVIELTGLAARARDAVFGLSGGMKQRISLACALVHLPRLLLLDEPTAGVDPQLREAFWHHFRRLAVNGTTLLVSTHLMDEALQCDRIAVLRNGTVLACDTPANLLSAGHATIHVHRGDVIETTTTADYATTLPAVLQRYGLDPSVTRIDVERDSLETVVLAMIRARESDNVARE